MELKKFKTKALLEAELCQEIISILQAAIDEHGRAHLLLSGGSTPLRLYSLMGQSKLDCSKIKIGLVDERFVSWESEYSNQRNIEQAINQSGVWNIKVYGMVFEKNNAENNLILCNELYKSFKERIDFCLLGMGEDGHTASIFPKDPASEKLLTQTEKGIYNTKAPNYPENRISCNKSMLLNSNNIALMLVGEKKEAVLKLALENNLPIAHFLNENEHIKVYLSEK